jgi:hypothetical protein
LLHRQQSPAHPIDFVANPKAQIGGDLVVAAAARVELAADVADPIDQRPLNVHVDVFEILPEVEPASRDFVADLFQAGDDLVPLLVGQHADFGEHVGVGHGAADIVGVEAAVEAHAFGELLDTAVRRLIKDTTPRLVGQCSAQSGPAAGGRLPHPNEN